MTSQRILQRPSLVAAFSMFCLMLSAQSAEAQSIDCNGLTCSDYATCEAGPACVCQSGYVTGIDALDHPYTQFTTCDDPNGLEVTVAASAAELAQALEGSGVTVTTSTETYSGAANASGTFSAGPLGMGAGVVLTTGDARLAPGPNEAAGITVSNGGSSSQRCLDIASGYYYFDAAELSFDFDLDGSFDGVCFDYMFGSEEYPEFVGAINDVAGVFLDGNNVGLDAYSDPITINGPFFSGDQVEELSGTEYDGSTPRLRICQPLAPGSHTLEIVVCDATDELLDSGIFVSTLSGYTGSPPPLSWCGDGNVDDGEECDDGNTLSDDDCSRECKVTDPNCGDGTLDSGEECDDGDRVPLDGCDDVCEVESGWMCSGDPSVCVKQPAGACSDDSECDDSDPCTVDTCNSGTCEQAEGPDSDDDGTCDAIDDCEDDPDKVEPGDCGCGQEDTDSDDDDVPDCNDECPDDPDKTEPGDCGCGEEDTDSDDDDAADCNDECPDDPDKTEPGDCGCGTPEDDADCLSEDRCPDDPDKTRPGQCGCGEEDTDSDGDDVPDCDDECPDNPDKVEEDACGCDEGACIDEDLRLQGGGCDCRLSSDRGSHGGWFLGLGLLLTLGVRRRKYRRMSRRRGPGIE